MGLLLIAAAAGLTAAAWRLRGVMRNESQPASDRPPAQAEAGPGFVEPPAAAMPANDKNAAVAAKPDLRKLKGRWRRTGEQYVIEVREIADNGRVDAAYFNPRPIRVSRAMAAQKDGAPALFVELNDTGYPGCTYNLIHDPKNDQLVGVYYQAAMQESYDVVFERMN